ncbi:1-phosphofructokinase family hexose kinase [Microbacterium sp. Marseille-Q6965]|uniref:1-phosphofructokinase family hexose kinase n=1 Tax=Microbacterium sp. Marseille-Q6965 TaxID=2965072 RepID=UPI0021B7629D|nr:PfkB family carbohydrate kinase [Microbacterium sp. Marseille-Q6965]
MSDVTIFAPSPALTVTIEDHEAGPDIHVHAGGQGVWQARMMRRLGASVTLCCVLTGEIGRVVRDLLENEGFTVAAVERSGRGASYVHDRRGGERLPVAETAGDAIGRHELDELYGIALREGLDSGLVSLSGPDGDGTLPADTYRRLAADLREGGARVVVDLSGERLLAALEGGVDVLKVSDEELRDDELLDGDEPEAVLEAMARLRARGAGAVVVTRASEPLLLLDAEGAVEISPPRLEAADTRGAGDSLTAGLCAGLALGESLRDAVTLGAAAGALNVTRHGLGTGETGTIERLREAVRARTLSRGDGAATPHLSPGDLAALASDTNPTERDDR